MAGEVRSVVLKRGPEGGFGFSILGGSGSELPPIVYDIVAGSPASNSGQLEAGDVILEVNDQEVSDLTTKEVLKCLRLSEQSVSLKLRKDDAVRQRVSQYLQSPQTLEQLRPAITQRDLAHVREVVAMKGSSRRAPAAVPRVPLVHSPPKGRAKPLPPPSEARRQTDGAAHTNGHGGTAPAPADGRPRFEAFTMTGELMLNLSRLPADELPPPGPPADGGGSAPTSPPAAPSGGGGGLFRGSRSEDRLLSPPAEADSAAERAGSVDPLPDTDTARGNGPSPAQRILEQDNDRGDEQGNDRGDDQGNDLGSDQGNDLGNDQGNAQSSGRSGTASGRSGERTDDAGGGRPCGESRLNGETTEQSGAHGPGPVPGSPDSDDGSDSESQRSLPPPCPRAVDGPSAGRLAKRLYMLEGFRRSDVSRHLGKNNEFSRAVAEEYVKHFDFSGCSLDVALGQFLERFSLTGETQERERVLVHFSRRYMDGNPAAFNSVDACHTLTCALMLLNTDLHVQHVPRKMTCAEFVDNLSELNDGRDFPEETLRRLYQAIRARPIHYAADDEYEEMEAAPATGLPPGGGVTNPFLAAPDPDKATEYKRGYMMRKCCLDAGGKRTALGRRSWQMFHCTLRDLVLYLHKDESGSRRAAAFEHLHNAIRVHHALASKAEDYVKKQHVFKLQTADQAEYLLQTSDAKELQSWVDTVNFVAASLSSPPLPGAVGSQRRFQRPLLPSGVTSRSLHDQLLGHEDRLAEIEAELAELDGAGDPEGRPSHQQRQYQRHKAAFLQAEAVRYRTYCQLLRSKMAAEPPPPAPLAAAAAVSPTAAADRGRPGRTADSAVSAEEEPSAAAGSGVTKEHLLSAKKQRRSTPDQAQTVADSAAGADGSVSPPTGEGAAAAERPATGTAAQGTTAGASAAADGEVTAKKKRRWWQK
ncbi:PH and SEC7 domain-containing protein-like isoform X2 [Amphibalanus amphitrite]|uniref:PH and SEC7 domain-containing protein-like isoform X2 n=1 Tax=Amphibalanus amphitrite TaxID=1232801 RepID=UPI001C917649|nr:PH and SEC7 domain-containing protein-like isoform X2 [Amphibalanus amphitrite]